MQNTTSVAELKSAIRFLEDEQARKEQELKEQLLLTFESVKPINIIKSSLKDIVSSPYLTDNILATVSGMAGGYVSSKILVGTSKNIGRKLLGNVLRLGVTNFVTRNPQIIKSFGLFVLQQILHKKKKKNND